MGLTFFMASEAAMNRLFLVLSLLLFSFGCTTGFSARDEPCPVYEDFSQERPILAVGDSVFAWRMRTCETVPDVAAIELGRPLRHKAINGARLTGGEKTSVVDQYEKGEWEWVIVDGGGNDLNNECECGVDCGGVLDELVSEDGSTGELAQLVDEIRRDGAKVVLYGYFRIDEHAFYGFDECIGELDILHERQSKLAAQREGVFFADGRTVVSPETKPGAYAFDHVHPSAVGARLVGGLIAKTIRDAETKGWELEE